jgi:2-dehydropantoate 2-reductase
VRKLMGPILIQGIGGIGGVVAARVIQSGCDATLVTGNPQITQAINRDGIHITTPEGEATVRARAHTSLDDLRAGSTFDAACLLMKANAVVEAARSTLPLLNDGGYLVTFQNGIVEDVVAAVVGAERVIGGIISWGGTMHAPGVYEKTSGGTTHIGELNGQMTPRLESLAKTITPAAPVVMTANIRGALWSKLAINCTITTIGALTGDTLGLMLRDARVRRLFARTYSEVIDTADSLGIHLENVGVNPRLLYVSRNASVLTQLAKDVLVRVAAGRYSRLKSSMLQSLERHRPTEIDFLNGYVVGQAKAVGVDVPVNAALVKLIKEIESGRRSIERRNINDLIGEVGA